MRHRKAQKAQHGTTMHKAQANMARHRNARQVVAQHWSAGHSKPQPNDDRPPKAKSRTNEPNKERLERTNERRTERRNERTIKQTSKRAIEWQNDEQTSKLHELMMRVCATSIETRFPYYAKSGLCWEPFFARLGALGRRLGSSWGSWRAPCRQDAPT